MKKLTTLTLTLTLTLTILLLTIPAASADPNNLSGVVSPQNMTSNTDPSPYIAFANQEANPAFQAWNGNTSDGGWGTFGGGVPGYIGIDLGGNTTNVTSFGYNCPFINCPENFELQASHDNTNWLSLLNETGGTNPSGYVNYTFGTSETRTYRYWRLYINSVVGGYGNANLDDIQLYGNFLEVLPPEPQPPGVQNLTVVKVVINDNGGSSTSFPLFINATPTANGSTTNLSTGTYQVTETGTFGYALTYSGDCDSNGIVTLAANESKTCTLTNNDVQGTLTVTKIVTNNDNGTLGVANFSLFVNASSVTSGVSTNRNAGTYLVSETPVTGYTGIIAGDCTTGGIVTVGLNQSRSCTITNNDNPAVPPAPLDSFDAEFTSTFNAVIALFVILLLFSIGFVWADKKGYVSNDVRKYFWSITGLIITVIILGLLFV